ncbi:hypothetical protein CHS0354_030077 [Potamilus streckersoni]|uniref:VWFA domain-containing protein n=1 Tax=Potamilus streckersoni TaxID=2493646 RepID=A0AAE0VGF1_9BIVA|nr:hypothetical protein CHS0354_030077 [Potamilus streckersoni]
MEKRSRLISRDDNLLYKTAQIMRTGLYLTALFLLTIALMRPQGKPQKVETATVSKDIIILLDVSRSMLARDVVPNRLEKAKDIIRDLTGTLAGERIALITFSGAANMVSPLTTDYYFFLRALDKVNTDTVSKGGSEIGTALDYVRAVFAGTKEQEKKKRHVILITDGENLSSDPAKSARAMVNEEFVINPVSIGTSAGGKIPLSQTSSEYVTFNGQEVITRPDEAGLRELADISGGIFIPAGNARVEMGKIYKTLFFFDLPEREADSMTEIRRQNSDIKNRIRYATDAVNSLRDAWSYLQIIPEKKEYETMVRVAAEQAKRFYADIMEKHISDKPPLEIIQELLTREENIQKQLNTLKNISPGDPKVKQLIKEQQKIISLMNTLP